MLPILQIGPLALPTPQLILLAGFWLGFDLTERQAARYSVKSSTINNLILIMLIAGLIGARLAYAAQAPSIFLSNPLNLLAVSPQMFDVNGGLLTAAAAGLAYVLLRRLALVPTLDALVTLLSVMAVSLGLAHLASGDAFGAPARLPWSIPLWGELRHPSQAYETLAGLIIAILAWPGGRFSHPSETGRHGFRFWSFLALSAGTRLFLETFRGDSTLVAGFREAQVIAWLVLAASLWGLRQAMRNQPPGKPADTQQNTEAEEKAS